MVSSLLGEIMKIEKQAEEILETAKENSKRIKRNVEIEKENLKLKIKTKTEEKLKNFIIEEEKNFSEKVNELEKEKLFKLNSLNQMFNDNQSEWIEKIVFDVIKQ